MRRYNKQLKLLSNVALIYLLMVHFNTMQLQLKVLDAKKHQNHELQDVPMYLFSQI
ncbi:hypothetical protein D3C72_1805480 [compost metagenome]